MTDNEIINNIIWCIDPKNACADCPYYELRKSLDCVSSLFRDTLNLINRQKAEIEEYKEANKRWSDALNNANEENSELQRKIVSCNSDILNEYKARIQVDELVVCADSLGDWMDFVKKTEAEAIKEFVDKVHTEIHQALESNYKARQERMEKYINANGTDEFIQYCEGKIAALRGIDDFVDETYKEMVGDNDA